MKRGEIYYIERSTYETEGSEQRAGRPAIIVSNDKCNASSPVIEIVYLTTQPKSDLPTHIDIRSAPRNSVALCEQINSVAVSRLGEKIGECSEYEMQMVDAALEISLALNRNTPPRAGAREETGYVTGTVKAGNRYHDFGSPPPNRTSMCGAGNIPEPLRKTA